MVKNITYNVYEEKGLVVENGLYGGIYYAKVGARVALNGNPKKLTELILEQAVNEEKKLETGVEWDLDGGFALVANQIGLEDKKVWFSLKKDGKEIDSEVVEKGSVYTYSAEEIAGETDVPMFVTYVDVLDTETNIVQLRYTWLISDDVEDID